MAKLNPTEIYIRHRPMVQEIVRKIIHNDNDIEDVVQDVFRKYMQHAYKLKTESEVAYWLIVVAKTTAIDAWHARKTERQFCVYSLDDPNGPRIGLVRNDGIEEAVAADETLQVVLDILDGMDTRYAAALRLWSFCDLRGKEIAAMLNTNVATVHVWLFRGRRILRRELKRRGFDDEGRRMV